MPTIDIHPDYETLSAAAAQLIVERVDDRPGMLLCVATGSTPTRTYELMATRPPSMFDELRILKLDEWGGVPMESPATCETYLRKILIDPLNLSSRYTAFESEPIDADAECARIARWLDQNGPIDLCILGLGINGHLGFNEPASALHPRPHVATLSSESLQHSMIQNLATKPTFGLTLGIEDILDSREIILLVNGASKTDALFRALYGDISPQFPAACLRKHKNTRIICDRAAAAKIS
jgi:galactosamine-6-phosphate isomerase